MERLFYSDPVGVDVLTGANGHQQLVILDYHLGLIV